MTDSVEGAEPSHTIFTTSFSGLRAVLTSQGTWSGFALYATPAATEPLWLKPGQTSNGIMMTWNEVVNAWEANWKDGNLDSSFGRRFRLLHHSGGQARIVAVADAIVLE